MFKKIQKKIIDLIGKSISSHNDETILLAIGSLLSNQQLQMNSKNINDYEFKIFSQFGDDGIIQYLIKNIEIKNDAFIEFGVQDYMESNTRFLMMNNNWRGFVMDGSKEAMDSLKKRDWYWRYDLTQKTVFINVDNINDLLKSMGFSDIGILHIDIDGNDYHILNAIELSELNPSIIIMEYNSVFGKDRAITVPYDKDFIRTKHHYSNLYYGTSLPALKYLANKKGYALVGCNNAGNNSYFVRTDLLNEKIIELSVDVAFKESKLRESRDKNQSLTFLSGKDRFKEIEGLEVINVITNQKETL
jgi:hypothetical protein